MVMENTDVEELKNKLKLDLTFTCKRCKWCDPQAEKEQTVKRKILNEAVSSYSKKYKQHDR